MKRYDVRVAALQETLRFGSAMYCVGESVALAADRPVPRVRELLKRFRGKVSSHSAFWTNNNSVEKSRRAVEGMELQDYVYIPVGW